jgi:subtilisin family serine protease
MFVAGASEQTSSVADSSSAESAEHRSPAPNIEKSAAVRSANLDQLMDRTCGSPEVQVGLLDGPVAVQHSAFASAHITSIDGSSGGSASDHSGAACTHGTFVAGVLVAGRETEAPAICPDCSLVVSPIFRDVEGSESDHIPSITVEELAAVLRETIDAGVRVINLSAAFYRPTVNNHPALRDVLDRAARRDVLIVAAVGNQASVGTSQIIRHPAVLPVVAADSLGRPLDFSNLSASAARRGLSAPGSGVTSINARGGLLSWSGTSVAAPFVTGTIALLYSLFPAASSRQIRAALNSGQVRSRTIVPPALNAVTAYAALAAGAYL